QLVAILSYITLIGWIIALVLYFQKKTKLGGYHLRQTLLLMIVAIVLTWIPVIGWIIGILLFVLWIIGLIGAIQGEQKPIPLLGPWAQDWFKGL
ncbi:MAG: hypothetical protein ABIA93_04705, partial [Candidatus Woesearchaeota archaeon]